MGYKEILKTKLEMLMKQNKVTNEMLSDATGISRSSINRIRMNKGNPTLETLHAICDFFKVSMQDLTGNAPIRQKGIINYSQEIPVVNWDTLGALLKDRNKETQHNAICAVITPQEYTHIPKSSLLYFDKTRMPAHGDYVLVIEKENGVPHVAEYVKDILSEFVRSCLAQAPDLRQLIPLNQFHLLGVLLESRKVFVSGGSLSS